MNNENVTALYCITLQCNSEYLYCISLGPQPVGVQCPLTSSLFQFPQFPGYWNWLRYPGLPPVLMSIAFPPSPSISLCFSIHSSPAFGFHSGFFFTTGLPICTHSIDPSFADGEFRSLELAPVPDVVAP